MLRKAGDAPGHKPEVVVFARVFVFVFFFVVVVAVAGGGGGVGGGGGGGVLDEGAFCFCG